MNGFRWKYALPLYYRHLIGRTWGFTIHRDIFSVGRTHEHKDWPAENAELSEICCVHCWNGQPSNNVIIILPQKYHREIANADKLVFYYSLYMFFFCSKAPHMDEWTEPRKEDIDCRCERGHCENMHYMWRVCGDQRIYGARSSHPIFTKLWKHRRWPAMGDYYWFSLECSHPCDSDMNNKKKLAQWYPFSIEYRALVITLALIFIPNIADRRIYMWIQSLCGAQFLWWLKIGRKKKHNVRMWFALLFASGFVLPKAII